MVVVQITVSIVFSGSVDMYRTLLAIGNKGIPVT